MWKTEPIGEEPQVRLEPMWKTRTYYRHLQIALIAKL